MSMTHTQQAAMLAAFTVLRMAHRDAIGDGLRQSMSEVLQRLKDILAEPAMEPVAHSNSNGIVHAAGYPWGSGEVLTPLYASPPPPAKLPLLSVTEILDVMRDGNNCNYNDEAEHVDFARAIEQLVHQKAGGEA